MARIETDRMVLTRLDERIGWLVRAEEQRTEVVNKRLDNHTARISILERFRSYTVGIAAGVSAIISLVFLALRLKWLQ